MGVWGYRGTGALGRWGMGISGSRRFFSLLDAPFMFYCGVSIGY